MPLNIPYDKDQLASICQRFHVAKLELFGSRAKGEARPDSDVDLLVTFEEGRTPGLAFFAMCLELEALFSSDVDVLTRGAVERDSNSIFKKCVLSYTEDLYAA